MSVHDVVAQFGNEVGIAGLHLNAQGQARIQVDGKFAIELEWAPGESTLHVFSVLGVAAGEQRFGVFEKALTANLFGAETGALAIGFDASRGELVLCGRLSEADLSSAGLADVITDMANRAEALRESLFAHAEVSESRAVHDPSVFAMMRA
jgi:hypothetical protein